MREVFFCRRGKLVAHWSRRHHPFCIPSLCKRIYGFGMLMMERRFDLASLHSWAQSKCAELSRIADGLTDRTCRGGEERRTRNRSRGIDSHLVWEIMLLPRKYGIFPRTLDFYSGPHGERKHEAEEYESIDAISLLGDPWWPTIGKERKRNDRRRHYEGGSKGREDGHWPPVTWLAFSHAGAPVIVDILRDLRMTHSRVSPLPLHADDGAQWTGTPGPPPLPFFPPRQNGCSQGTTDRCKDDLNELNGCILKIAILSCCHLYDCLVLSFN